MALRGLAKLTLRIQWDLSYDRLGTHVDVPAGPPQAIAKIVGAIFARQEHQSLRRAAPYNKSLATIDRQDFGTLMAQFAAEDLADFAIELLVRRREGSDPWSTGCRAVPPGELTVSLLRIGVAQTVHLR